MYQIPTTVQQNLGLISRAVYPVSHLSSPPNGVVMSGANTLSAGFIATLNLMPADRNTSLDITFDCKTTDNAGTQRLFFITADIVGTWVNTLIVASPLEVTITNLGAMFSGVIINGLLTLSVSLKPSDTYINFADAVKSNWIKWSDIGSLDFTVGRDNVAGERPLDWKGYVYCVKKLGSRVVVYGQNGVSFILPNGNVMGLETIYRVGLKGKHAVTGDNSKHFFVDNSGKLWKLADGIHLLDYSEYLSLMNSSLAMSYDEQENLVYICDGVYGFVYDAVSGSFGKCPPNITGVGYQSGTQYIAASSAITNSPFEICTDIFDLGTRAGKTIFSVELGTDVTTTLYVSVDWRRDKAGNFTQTPWYEVSAQGRAIVIAYGREFRFRVKAASYEAFDLDYIKVNGAADAY